MKINPLNSPVSLEGYSKDKQILLQSIRRQVAKRSGEPLEAILKYPELRRYRLALEHCTTTNKAVCMAMLIPVEAGCRYKARLEKNDLLVSSMDKTYCPYTGDKAHLLSTNPTEFEKLSKTRFNQLTIF